MPRGWVPDTDDADVVSWVDTTVGAAGPATHRMAVYHVPLYSALADDYDSPQYLRDVWPTELFDRHKFVAAFENHSHLYKRTVPLVANRPAPPSAKGTVYMGDGNIGVSSVIKDGFRRSDPRFAQIGADYHFFSVDVRTDRVSVRAINPTGVVIDTWTSSNGGVT